MTEQWDEIAVFERIVLVVFFGVFVFLTTQYFYSPDFSFFAGQYEDAWTAAHWAQGLHSNQFMWKIWYFPIYPGTLSAHLMTPLFYIFENSWVIVRLWPVVWGLATAGLGYAFVRGAFGRIEAVIYAGFSALNFGYILAVRSGHYHQSAVTFFVTLTLWSLHRWWLTGAPRWLSLGFLSMGLGLLTRAWFIWFLAGLSAGIFLSMKAFSRRLGWDAARLRRELLIRCAFYFFPFVVVGLFSQFVDISRNASLVLRDQPGFSQVAGNLQSILSGSFFGELISGRPLDTVSRYFPLLALCCFVAGGVMAFVRWFKNEENMIGAVWIMLIGMFCMAWCSPRTPTYHLFVFYPVIFILMAAVIGMFFRRVQSGRMQTLCGLVVCMALVFLEKPAWEAYFGSLRRGVRVISQYTALIDEGDSAVPVLNLSRSNNMRFLCPNHRFLAIPEGMTFDGFLRREIRREHIPERFAVAGFRHEFPPGVDGDDPLEIEGYREKSRANIPDQDGNILFRYVLMSR